ncbi:transposase family protein [Streptomyces sp. NPDC057798]|uniref:transposase family protein n=1 Tax=Streptomyces sp. NPDC057798 TaxID=3346252 RepID=UPI0036887E20
MPSSLIDVLQRHRGNIDLPELRFVSEVLDCLPDPRRVWGRRYRLGSLLALCLLTVLGGATTPAGISRFAVGADPGLREKMVVRSAARDHPGPSAVAAGWRCPG